MSLTKIKEVNEALERIREKITLVNDQLLDNETGNPIETTTNKECYTHFIFEGLRFSYHRVVFYLHSGLWPEIVDHIDRNRYNNHPSNLRAATKAENNRNKSKQENATSVYKGVSYHKGSGKWQASITFNGMRKHLGYFTKPEEAARAYDIYAVICFREFAVINNHAETARILDLVKERMIEQRKLEKALSPDE